MNLKNVKNNPFVQESVLDINKDITQQEKEKEKKPQIELTNVKEEEEDDEDSYKFIEAPIGKDIDNQTEIKVNKLDKKRIFKELACVIFNCISFLFYYLSLEGCFLKQEECIPLLSTMFLGRIAIFGVLAAILTCVQIYLIIFRIMKFYHLIYTILFYIVMFNYDHGTKLDYHGGYNIVIFTIFVVIFSFLTGIIIIIIKTIINRKKIPCIILSIIILFIIIRTLIFFHSLNSACQNWDKGLNNTVLDNSAEYDCKIAYPKKCLINKINDFFDFSRLTFTSCSPNYNMEKENKLFVNSIRVDEKLKSLSSLTHFGFPITVNNPILWKNETKYYDFPNLILDNIILMDLYNHPDKKYYGDEILKPEVEIIYDKKTKKRDIKINLIKNETLSEERKKIETDPENRNKSLYKNILFIYIDCISRPHFLRKMKKTSSFLERFMSFNSPLSLSSYQFMKYQTFCGWTNPNVLPMFYSSIKNNHQMHLLTFLKQNGYVTGHTHNLCSKESFEYNINSIKDGKIELDEYDHENAAMFCDPVYIDAENPYPVFSGPYSVLRRCLSGYDTNHYMLEYGKQFWYKYDDNKKYLRLNFQDAHEFSGQVSKYLDEPLYNFLVDLYEKKLLDDTAIFIASDHGNSYFPYLYYHILRSDDATIEVTYGTLFIIVPNYKNEENKKLLENINIHQQSLVTPFDIHDTIIHIAYGNNLDSNSFIYSNMGKSLFGEFEYKNRNCSTYARYIISKRECLCENKLK